MKKSIRYGLVILCVLSLLGCGGEQEEDIEIIEPFEASTESVVSSEDNSGIDYDLTQMNSDMVYATIYQLMMNPEPYIGKTICIRGSYYATWYEPTQNYYHYVIVEDAMACCAQGIEFVWEDGSHVYPEEYPRDETQVEVTGVFETYREPGDTNLYCRLKDASMTVLE